MRKNKFILGLFIAALMLVGASSLLSIHTSAQQLRIIALTQGWNLVTWTGEKQSAAEALDSVSDAVSAVYGYNNDYQTFTRYIVDRPEISTLTDFEPENAYWVLVDRYSATWWVPGPSCPTATPCPDCPPAANLLSEACAGVKAGIETSEVLLDIAEEGLLIGMTESEVRANLAQSQQNFDENCQGVLLSEPSLLTFQCAVAGKWKGSLERENLYAPDPQNTVWINQFDNIIDRYCKPSY